MSVVLLVFRREVCQACCLATPPSLAACVSASLHGGVSDLYSGGAGRRDRTPGRPPRSRSAPTGREEQ